MRKFSKEFWRGLLVTVIILGAVYSCTIYLALKERRQKEECRKRDEERRERIRLSQDSARLHADSIRRSVRVKKLWGIPLLQKDMITMMIPTHTTTLILTI